MTREEILDVVKSILARIAPEVDLARMRPDADLRDEMEIDSMDFLRYVVGLKERLGVDVPERDYPKVRTLASCAEYVMQRKAA